MAMSMRYNASSLSIACMAAVLVVSALLTISRNSVYRSDLRLWEATMRQSADKRRPHQNYGRALSKAGRLDEALAQFNAVLQLQDDGTPLADTFRETGTVYFFQQRYDLAIATWLSGLAVTPERDGRPLINIAMAYEQKGDLASAFRYAERAREVSPRLPKVWNTLGALYMARGDYDLASECFLKALDLKPDEIYHYLNAALALEKAGRYEEAYQAMAAYASGTPDESKKLSALAFLQRVRQEAEQGGGRTAGSRSSNR